MTFKIGTAVLATVPLVVQGGQAVAKWTSALLGMGAYTITAAYNGDAADFTSSGIDRPSSVGKDATKTVAGPSVAAPVRGQAIAINAIVSVAAPGAGDADGDGDLQDGATVLGTRPLVKASNGLVYASLATVPLGMGTYTFTTMYNGDSGDTPSTGTTSFTVGKDATTTVAVPSTANPVRGQAVTLTAAVLVKGPGSGTPTGTVTFKDGALRPRHWCAEDDQRGPVRRL